MRFSAHWNIGNHHDDFWSETIHSPRAACGQSSRLEFRTVVNVNAPGFHTRHPATVLVIPALLTLAFALPERMAAAIFLCGWLRSSSFLV
jgi:hypothetical protein